MLQRGTGTSIAVVPQQLAQLLDFHRFHQMSVETGLGGAQPIGILPITGNRDQLGRSGFGKLAQPTR